MWATKIYPPSEIAKPDLTLRPAWTYLDNSVPENWSLSPETENSLWLYEEGTEINNFGSPREENSFRLVDTLIYFQPNDTIFYVPGDTHTVKGDYHNYYTQNNSDQILKFFLLF